MVTQLTAVGYCDSAGKCPVRHEIADLGRGQYSQDASKMADNSAEFHEMLPASN
jgi:hypothetical protein